MKDVEESLSTFSQSLIKFFRLCCNPVTSAEFVRHAKAVDIHFLLSLGIKTHLFLLDLSLTFIFLRPLSVFGIFPAFALLSSSLESD